MSRLMASIPAHGVGDWIALLTALAIGVPTVARILSPFRGLLFPLFARRPGSKVRQALQINSHLPRWRSATTFLLAWICPIVGLYMLLNSQLKDNGLVQMVLFFAGCIYLALIYNQYQNVRRREQLYIQGRRDNWAQRAFESLTTTSDQVDTYSLWLRPFTSTGRLWVVQESKLVKLRHEDISKEGFHVRFGDFETMLAKAIEPFAPLIALGTGGDVGAGRIETSDDGWRDAFRLLASSATVIFLLPALRPGTYLELQWILQTPSILQRSILVVPPTYTLNKRIRAWYPEPGLKLPRELWPQESELREARSETLEALAKILDASDYEIVENASSGMLIQLSNESAPRIVSYAELRMSEWWLAYWGGPRFVQSHLRSTVRDLMGKVRATRWVTRA